MIILDLGIIDDRILIPNCIFFQDEIKEEPKHNGDASTSGEKSSAPLRY